MIVGIILAYKGKSLIKVAIGSVAFIYLINSFKKDKGGEGYEKEISMCINCNRDI
ncbi:MAG: hypothetical protein ACRDDY_17310 [Clostridium sp.]|uniref:hypothetical protein n=1 Tax=Clostridium sp. TaxID=1506 RepID=UPI003EE5ADE5